MDILPVIYHESLSSRNKVLQLLNLNLTNDFHMYGKLVITFAALFLKSFMLSMRSSDANFDLSLYLKYKSSLFALSFNVIYEQSLSIFTYLIAFIFQEVLHIFGPKKKKSGKMCSEKFSPMR